MALFVTAQTAFRHCTLRLITAHFVYHCTVKQALPCVQMGRSIIRNKCKCMWRHAFTYGIYIDLFAINFCYKLLNEGIHGRYNDFTRRV